jgi:hypothetical protein
MSKSSTSSSSSYSSVASAIKRKIHDHVKKADLQPTVILKANTPGLIPAKAAVASPVVATDDTSPSSYFTQKNVLIFVAIVLVLVGLYFAYKKWSVISNLGVAYVAPQLGAAPVSEKHAEAEVKLLEEGKHPFVPPAVSEKAAKIDTMVETAVSKKDTPPSPPVAEEVKK